MDKPCLILGIESSCDETAAAVVANGREIRSNIIATQAAVHQQYGGVVQRNWACVLDADGKLKVTRQQVR